MRLLNATGVVVMSSASDGLALVVFSHFSRVQHLLDSEVCENNLSITSAPRYCSVTAITDQ